MPTASINEGLWRIGGMYGQAYDQAGNVIGEVTEVTATVEINRIEVPLVGKTRTGYKPGREAREGTMTIQKIDSRWELEIFRFLAQSLQDRRAARGTNPMRAFSLSLELDDPDALGVEKWQLNGCQIWRLPLGFNIGDDIINREFPITFESETPISVFTRTGATNATTGLPQVTQFDNKNPLPASPNAWPLG